MCRRLAAQQRHRADTQSTIAYSVGARFLYIIQLQKFNLKLFHFKDISIEDCHLSGCCFINEFGCFHKLPSLHQFVNRSHILRPTQSLTPFGNPSVSSLEYCISTLARNRLAIVLQQTNHTKSCDSHNPGKLHQVALSFISETSV